MRMRREACHNGPARIGQVVRKAGHLGPLYPRVDEQHAGPALHDNGVALAELALVDQHTICDLPQHGASSACGLQPVVETVGPGDTTAVQSTGGSPSALSRLVIFIRRPFM